MNTAATLTQERQDLLETLARHRYFLISATEGISDEQARLRTTVSELTLGGLIKHVASVEEDWAEFIRSGPTEDEDLGDDWDSIDPETLAKFSAGFILLEDETLEGVLAYYVDVARATDELVRTVDLDKSWPLPKAPWNEPGATQTARRTFMHIVAETAQHAGHADIIRETLDGKKSMG